MHGTVPAAAQRAIFPAAQSSAGRSIAAQSCGFVEDQWFKRLASALWKSKPGATLHFLTEVPERTCQAYASGSRDPGDFIVRLLWSSEGSRVLGHIMRGCKAEWWQRHQLAEICLAAKLHADAEIAEGVRQLELQL